MRGNLQLLDKNSFVAAERSSTEPNLNLMRQDGTHEERAKSSRAQHSIVGV